MTQLPTEFEIIKQKKLKNLNINNKMKTANISPNKEINKKYKKPSLIGGLNNARKNGNIKSNTNTNPNSNSKDKANKTKKLKKLIIKNKLLNERFHSSDVIKRKTNNEIKKNQNDKIYINKKIGKKILKLDFNKRFNTKTPSPINYRQSSSLLIDRDTIIRNKNKKINYNGYYYNDHIYNNKIIQKKVTNTNINKKQVKHKFHLKIKSDEFINNKDLTKEEEKKLDEQIINSTIDKAIAYNNQNDTQINSSKNIIDLSQNILQKLEYMNNMDINKIESLTNLMNLSEVHKNNYINYINKKNDDNLFKSNYIQSLYLAIKLGFFSPWDKLKLLLISKELNFKFDIKDIIKDYFNYYKTQILLINNEIQKYDINKINKAFTPRKTGLNSLNFITKNEEQRLINELQHEYVIKIFKIILILLNEYNNYKNNEKENEKNSKIFEYLFNEVYIKYNVNNIKDLFTNNFVDKVPLISDDQFNMINEIIKEVPDLLSPSTLLAYNRNVSYLTFFLSELYNYLSIKTEDNIYYYKIRNEYSKISEYLNKINKLKIYLS